MKTLQSEVLFLSFYQYLIRKIQAITRNIYNHIIEVLVPFDTFRVISIAVSHPNHTVHGQASWSQFTSTQCDSFNINLTTALFESTRQHNCLQP